MKIFSSLVIGILMGGLLGVALFNQAILPKAGAQAIQCRHERAECTINNTGEPCCEGLTCNLFNDNSGNGKCGTVTGEHHFICSDNACIPTEGAGTDACTSDAECAPPPPVCGNSTIETGETCDDGNTVSGDGCSATCQTETPPLGAVCGNSVIETGETCDDGNLIDGDGCSATCQTETIVSPSPTPGLIITTTTTGGPGDGLSDGRSDGGSSCPSCTAPPSGAVLGVSTEGQVLGASTDTLGATGSNYQLARLWIAATSALVIFLLGHTLVRGNETS